jgi:hypothetical protein
MKNELASATCHSDYHRKLDPRLTISIGTSAPVLHANAIWGTLPVVKGIAAPAIWALSVQNPAPSVGLYAEGGI